ncbi:MAG: radical SAM protein [Clostridiales bacterium]|nr:radical SAM protein [Clostridiales bacterium]
MKTLSLLIKPASGLCNMRCDYCFYRAEVANLSNAVQTHGSSSIDDATGSQTYTNELFHPFEQQIMSSEMIELLIRKACENTSESLQIVFQGGEPAVAGLDFFQKFTDMMEKTRRRRLRVSYAFQTNGLLLDEKWAELFLKYHFLIGLSFDGTDSLHDRWRTDTAGKGTASRVLSSWRLLQEKHIDVNLLCVVTRQMAAKPEKSLPISEKYGSGVSAIHPLYRIRQAKTKPENKYLPDA